MQNSAKPQKRQPIYRNDVKEPLDWTAVVHDLRKDQFMTAARKIFEAESILAKMERSEKIGSESVSFLGVIHDVFSHLLDEYSIKFGCSADRIGLEKFKAKAKKTGNLNAINFLIWYEKEYKKLRDNPEFGHLLDKEMPTGTEGDIVRTCSNLLKETKSVVFYAYENF
ncbi:MAG: hypothetical protein QW177_09380 [Candidatus Nitrosotenuis sp.]